MQKNELLLNLKLAHENLLNKQYVNGRQQIGILIKCIENETEEYEEKLRWIPVEEKLPENDIRVLTKFKNGKVIVNSYDTHMDKWQYEFDVEYTHWRSIL